MDIVLSQNNKHLLKLKRITLLLLFIAGQVVLKTEMRYVLAVDHKFRLINVLLQSL